MSSSTEIRICFPDLTSLELTIGTGAVAQEDYGLYRGETEESRGPDAFRRIGQMLKAGTGPASFRVALSALFEFNKAATEAYMEANNYGANSDAYDGYFVQIRHLD